MPVGGGKDSRSYSEVVGSKRVGGNGRGEGSFQGQEVKGEERSIVVPDKLIAFNELRGRAVVGRTVDLETLVDFDKLLRIAKTVLENLQYLGGLSILITFGDEAGATSFLNLKKVWEPWFTKLDVWDGQSLSLERVIWLKVSGVPLHLFDPEVLEMVGGIFGKVLHVQKSILREKDLSVSRVAVLAGEVSKIRETVKILWKDRVFRVWIEEEHEDWTPDCLGGAVMDSSPVVGSSDYRSPATGRVDSSPLISSPVARFSERGSQGGGEGNNEGTRMQGGAVNNDKSAGGGPDNVNDIRNVFNYDCFLGNDSGSSSAPVGKKGPFVFKSTKKSERQRKGACNIQGKSFVQLDSSEKARPSKRNRAQIEENSDPFSIDKLLGPKFNRDLKEDGEHVVSSGSAVEPSSPGSVGDR
ncbi:hypothetical protein Hanom_Chr05g00396491 [Helianthus anomalus]